MPRPIESLRGSAPRKLWLRRLAGLACLGALAVYALAGCQAPSIASAAWPDWASFRSQSPDEDEDGEDEGDGSKPGTKLETPLIGEYVTAFGGTSLIPIEGVGLVTGLDGTGEDPPPSQWRTRLIDEMKKRGVKEPNKILASPETAMVIVRAYLPVNIRKGEPFDVEVMLPPNSEATSLAGGHLLEARLAEQAVVQGGRLLDGDVFGTAEGPILVSNSDDASASAALLRRGTILGGGKAKVDRDLVILLRNEYRSGRNTMRIAQAIGKRFHGHDKHGIKVPMAEAKDDTQLTLKVPDEYKENYPRYLGVIRNMAFRETEIARRVRLQKLDEQLKVPATSETAALRLEGLGAEAIPVLKRALDHEDLEVRFNAAMALTYMGEADGLDELAEAAREEPAFRVYALAGLAASREGEASGELRTLLKEASSETRYGAFRSLTVLNEKDPAVAGQEMDGGYTLHVVSEGGPPLVHMTHHTKAEVVVFGGDQQLQLPAVLRAGPHIQVVGQQGSGEVVVSKYSGGQNVRRVVSPNLVEIIGACDELKATYPDIVDLLTQAHRRHNLPGELAIDALPAAGRTYVAKNSTAGGKRTIGNEYTAPTIFAPPTSEAAAARDADLKEVSADKEGGEGKGGEAEGVIRPAGAGEGEGGITTADGEVSKEDSDSEAGADEPVDEDAPSVIGDDHKWYDPRGLFTRPEWLKGDGAPEQSEPGAG